MVTSWEQQPLAVVRHPVDRPLQAGTDANGVLLGLDESSSQENQQNTFDLSPCSVGHLAQHTFGRILYDAAVQQSQNDEDGLVTIRYETGVKSVELPPSGPVIVTTETGETYETDLCVAADGAHSLIRRQLGIPRQGQEALQHLMNIHVRLTPHQAEKLHANNNHAMLYSVYSERVVAMVVCHSIGEYIVQIPFFPPYQTPEEDFGPEQLPLLLRAIFGEAAAADCQVLSSKPWTMSSLVANRYFVANDAADSAVLLAGDAAHVFPPAGGFGMNTGLQDAHNLAWKIAAFRSRRQQQRNGHQVDLRELLQSYEQERRPIAQQNAALSIRNYRRLLEVTKQLYLNEQHPALLTKMLDNSPLPLPARQAIFRSLLQTALYPLSWLNKSGDSLYRRHIQSNLRQILKTGAGLPLLFPKFEIGFCYDSMKKKGESSDDSGSSSGPSSPSLRENDWRSDTWANVTASGSGRPFAARRNAGLGRQ